MKTRPIAATWICLISIFVCAGFVQPLAAATPGAVGLSSERLKRIDDVMKQYIDEGKIAGAVTLVARQGHVVYREAFGMADIEDDRKMKTDSLFRIASMSKPITATAVMILYERGEFLLNDPISKYIPEFSKPEVLVAAGDGTFKREPARCEITIRHLLNHTSGLTYGWGGPLETLYRDANITSGLDPTDQTIGQMVKRLAKLPLISHPGEEMHYGLSIDVLGYLVEVISGKDLNTFCQEDIFEPLRMKDTYFILPEKKLDELASLYRLTDSGKLVKDTTDPEFLTQQQFFAGGAGLITTASDYAKFAQMILDDGKINGQRILSRKTVELMTSNSIGDLYAPFRYNSGDKMGYGFGIRTERGEFDELESLGIVGWDGAYFTRFWIDPEEELIGVFMTQMKDYWSADLATKFRVLVYQAIDD